MVYCPNCGAQNDDGVAFCANCGTSIAPAAPTPGYGAPVYGVPVAPVSTPGKGLAIASMVCGIVSFFCFGLVLGLLAVIFGAVAKSKGYTGGMATAGVVLGVIGLALYVVALIACGGSYLELMNMLEYM